MADSQRHTLATCHFGERLAGTHVITEQSNDTDFVAERVSLHLEIHVGKRPSKRDGSADFQHNHDDN